jgi:hypothetical protein
VVDDGVALNVKLKTDPLSQVPTPPQDLVSRHRWSAKMPSWRDENIVDVVRDYQATPSFGISYAYLSSGQADDVAIQQALNDAATPGHEHYGKTVFIPAGDYRITKPIVVPAGARLIGASKNSAVLQQAYDVWEDPSQPVLLTEDTPDGNIILSDFYICSYPCGRFYDIRSGNTVMRDIQTHVLEGMGSFPEARYPFATFSGNVSGKVFTLCSDWVASHCDLKKKKTTDAFHLLSIEQKSSVEPLRFYQASIEHLASSQGQVGITDSQQVRFHALKHENGGGYRLATIRNSSGISIMGSSGNYSANFDDHLAIISMENVSDVMFCSLTHESKSTRTDSLWIEHDETSVPDKPHEVLFYRVKK